MCECIGFIISVCNDLATALATFYFDSGIRTAFFSGFLSLGGFLFTLHTFVITNLKEKLYDDEDYVRKLTLINEHHCKQAVFRGKDPQSSDVPQIDQYAPLFRLSSLITTTIWVSMSFAVSQITVGIYRHWAIALFGIVGAIFIIGLVLFALVHIQSNLRAFKQLLKRNIPKEQPAPADQNR